MINRRICLIKYDEAKKYIQEGDVLLFRGEGILSKIIQSIGQGYYSHVGIASWVYDEYGHKQYLECIEFREWIGSRAISLNNYVNDNPNIIDVFRPIPQYKEYIFCCKQRNPIIIDKVFDGKLLTTEFRELTGLPYGWSRIFWLARFHILGLRLLSWSEGIEDEDKSREFYPVCSTIVAHLFAKHYTKLLRFRSSARTEPSDISRSPILNYMFTLVP